MRATALRDLVRAVPVAVRTWVEGLPDGPAAASALLDEFSRC